MIIHERTFVVPKRLVVDTDYAALNGDETLAAVLMAAGADPEISTMQVSSMGAVFIHQQV